MEQTARASELVPSEGKRGQALDVTGAEAPISACGDAVELLVGACRPLSEAADPSRNCMDARTHAPTLLPSSSNGCATTPAPVGDEADDSEATDSEDDDGISWDDASEIVMPDLTPELKLAFKAVYPDYLDALCAEFDVKAPQNPMTLVPHLVALFLLSGYDGATGQFKYRAVPEALVGFIENFLQFAPLLHTDLDARYRAMWAVGRDGALWRLQAALEAEAEAGPSSPIAEEPERASPTRRGHGVRGVPSGPPGVGHAAPPSSQ
jgi:hypothetical protein